MRKAALLLVSATLLSGALAQARNEIRIGVVVSATGPAASLGIPERNTVTLLPRTIGGVPVRYITLDDASDTTQAVTATRRLIQESNVDLIIGTTTTPASLAMVDIVAQAQVPNISLAASAAIVSPVEGARRWVFKTPQTEAIMADAITEHMQRSGVRTVAYIGFNDAYGEGWLTDFTRSAQARGIRLVATERYGRTDTSVTGQILRITAARPDAVLIGASGVPAVLPQRTLNERGFSGRVYQTHGVANADFLRVGGRDVEGAILPAGPMLVAEQLPANNPMRAIGLTYRNLYESRFGAGSVSTFGGHMFDAGLLANRAIAAALRQNTRPGTVEFRSAIRNNLENIRGVVGTHGIFNMSPRDHLGLDARSRVMVEVRNGAWRLLPNP